MHTDFSASCYRIEGVQWFTLTLGQLLKNRGSTVMHTDFSAGCYRIERVQWFTLTLGQASTE
jgi:hypothetical protein